MAVQLTVSDLLPFAPNIDAAQAIELIAGAVARAAEYAPCIADVSFDNDAAKDILRIAVLRGYQSEGGIITGVSVGSSSISYDTSRNDSNPLVAGLFTDAEISELQRMCRESGLTVSPMPEFGMPDAPTSWPDPAVITWTVV